MAVFANGYSQSWMTEKETLKKNMIKIRHSFRLHLSDTYTRTMELRTTGGPRLVQSQLVQSLKLPDLVRFCHKNEKFQNKTF